LWAVLSDLGADSPRLQYLVQRDEQELTDKRAIDLPGLVAAITAMHNGASFCG
jgi:hypothetical protein